MITSMRNKNRNSHLFHQLSNNNDNLLRVKFSSNLNSNLFLCSGKEQHIKINFHLCKRSQINLFCCRKMILTKISKDNC